MGTGFFLSADADVDTDTDRSSHNSFMLRPSFTCFNKLCETGFPIAYTGCASRGRFHLKKSFHFFVFVLGDGRLRHCGRRTTTAGNGLYWLGKLGRLHLGLTTLMMAASKSERSPQSLRIPMRRQRNRSMHINQRKWRLGQLQFLPWASLKRCVNIADASLDHYKGQSEWWEKQILPTVSDTPIIYHIFLRFPLLPLSHLISFLSVWIALKVQCLARRYASHHPTSLC